MAVTGILYHVMFARVAKPQLAVEMLEHLFQFGCAFFGFTVDDGVFYNYDSDSNIFIVDFHEQGRYPRTGDADETGGGPAKGTKMNVPMKSMAGDDDFAAGWKKAEAFIREMKPEFIVFQCGADSLQGDPITHLDYSPRSYQLAAESLCQLAEDLCDGRLVALGGGGYNLENISRAWPVVVRALL